MPTPRAAAAWGVLATAIIVPIALAAMSPLLAWRGPVYIAAGFFGILAMAALLLQPLLAARKLPGVTARKSRTLHRWIGAALASLVALHVAFLWITSPPDVMDVLAFDSPTPFSDWGAIAMWATFAAALLAAFRKRTGLRPQTWRIAHVSVASVVVVGSVVHALLIEGTMEPISKALLCALVVAAAAALVRDQIKTLRRSRPK